MSYFGVVKRVYDNQTKKEPPKPYWGVVIDTEAKGEVTFNLWDCTMAGRASADGEEAIFDVHVAAEDGRRVMFDVIPGKAKPDGGTYPASLKLIQYAEEVPPIGTLLADEARDPQVEAAMGAVAFVAAARKHAEQLVTQLKAAEEALTK